jgi:carbon storage regulator CsrA
MLVKKVRVNERIIVGEVEVLVVAIEGSQVRLGINAPLRMNIVRDELTKGKRHDIDISEPV